MDGPRRHYYGFAHQWLRDLALAGPREFFQVLDRNADRFLTDSWKLVGDRIAPEERLPVPAFSASTHETDDLAIAMIGMPEPEGMTEAHFVALVTSKTPSFKDVEGFPTVALYYTLEASQNLEGIRNTIIGAWSRNGSHSNLGEGPPPERDAFLKSVIALGQRSVDHALHPRPWIACGACGTTHNISAFESEDRVSLARKTLLQTYGDKKRALEAELHEQSASDPRSDVEKRIAERERVKNAFRRGLAKLTGKQASGHQAGEGTPSKLDTVNEQLHELRSYPDRAIPRCPHCQSEQLTVVYPN